MISSVHEITPVSLWQSTNIALPNERFLFILYYYKTFKGEDKKNGYYRCSIRMDSRNSWIVLSNSIIETNPAEQFRLTYIGIDNDSPLTYGGRAYNKADFSKWIKERFSQSKTETVEEFKKSQLEKSYPFLTEITLEDGTKTDAIDDFEKLEESKWYTSELKRFKPRKPYGRIIQ